MFTDMVDYSDMAASDEDAALDLLLQHNRIMKPLVTGHLGTVVKTIGDSIMGTFSAASDALDCAIAMQERLKLWNSRHADGVINVRIGVHVGDVVVTKHDIFGVVTNLAKRLEAISPSQSVCCTDAARLMVLHLPRYRFTKQGRWQPKGSTNSLDFFRVARTDTSNL